MRHGVNNVADVARGARAGRRGPAADRGGRRAPARWRPVPRADGRRGDGRGRPRAGDPLAPGYTEAVLRRAVEVFAEHGAILRAIDDAARRDADVEAAYREFTEWAVDATAQLFDLGVEAGNLQPFDTRNVARALTLLNRGYLLDTLTGERPEEPEVVLRTLMTVWTRTLQVES